MKRFVLWATLALSLTGCTSSGVGNVLMQPTDPRPVLTSADSLVLKRRAQPPPVTDSLSALAQVVLMLPFEDLSKFDGPWPIHTGLPAALADSLQGNRFLRITPVDSVLAFLTEDELRGDIDPARAADLARFLNADWAILGSIDDLTMRKFQATVPLGGHRQYQGVVAANLVLVNAVDGRPSEEVSAEGTVDSKQTGITNPAAYVPYERQYRLLNDFVWGSEEFNESLVGKALAVWAAKAAEGVSEDIRPPPSLKVLEPKIIAVDGLVAYINVGLVEGLRSGDKYGVWDHGRDLHDPDTGVLLGRAQSRRVGVVQVEQIINDHLTQVRIVEGAGQIATGFLLRAE